MAALMKESLQRMKDEEAKKDIQSMGNLQSQGSKKSLQAQTNQQNNSAHTSLQKLDPEEAPRQSKSAYQQPTTIMNSNNSIGHISNKDINQTHDENDESSYIQDYDGEVDTGLFGGNL